MALKKIQIRNVYQIDTTAKVSYISWPKRLPRKKKKAFKKLGPPILKFGIIDITPEMVKAAKLG